MPHRWEICTERERKAASGWVYVSLNRRGEIAMNAAAFARIKQPASVTLMYDAGNRCVGVKFPVAADRNFFRVRRYGRGGRMRIIRAARLLKQFDIRVEETLVFRNPETAIHAREPMLVLPLDEAAILLPPKNLVYHPAAEAAPLLIKEGSSKGKSR